MRLLPVYLALLCMLCGCESTTNESVWAGMNYADIICNGQNAGCQSK